MGGASSKPSKRPVVVIIGGGHGGTTLAAQLDASNLYEVIVIERREYFSHVLGLPRAAVEPKFLSQIVLPYDKLLRNGIVVHAEVASVDTDARAIRLHGAAEPLIYDHLVFATGSSYAFPRRVHPNTSAELQSALSTFNEELQRANNVVIVGGGAVGVELAGEIGTEFPNKSVTLVQRGPQLVSSKAIPKLHAQTVAALEALKVKVVLNDSIDVSNDLLTAAGENLYVPGSRQLTTTGGVQLNTDLIVFANGPLVNSAAYSNSPSLANSIKGDRLAVDEYFHIQGFQNAYAIGDCALIENKQAVFAGEQAKHLTANLIALAKGKSPKPYVVKGQVMIFLSIGRRAGVGEMNGGTAPGFIVRALKSKDLFSGMSQKLLKVKPPKDGSLLPLKGAAAYTELQKSNARLSLGLSDAALDELLRGYAPAPLHPLQSHV